MRQGPRSAAGRGLALGLGLVLALGGGELLARWAWGPSVETLVRRDLSQGPEQGLVQELADERVFGARPGHRSQLYRVSSTGTRGPERDVSRRADVGRILLLGDSVAFGEGIPEAQTLAPQLEARLADLAGGDWEVWNAAFVGYNTHQQAAALKALGPVLKPDLVLVWWVPNDAASLEHQQLDSRGEVVALYVDERLVLLPGLSADRQRSLWEQWALFRWLGLAWSRWKPDTPGMLLAESRYLEGLRSIAEQAERLGAPVVLAMQPPLLDYPGWSDPPQAGRPAPHFVREPAWRLAVEQGGNLGFELVDLTQAIAPRRPSSLRRSPGDRVHPSGEGHAVVADHLAPELLEVLGEEVPDEGGDLRGPGAPAALPEPTTPPTP